MTITLEECERQHIMNVLEQCGGNISEAARRLGLYRSTLQRKLRRIERGSALRVMEPQP